MYKKGIVKSYFASLKPIERIEYCEHILDDYVLTFPRNVSNMKRDFRNELFKSIEECYNRGETWERIVFKMRLYPNDFLELLNMMKEDNDLYPAWQLENYESKRTDVR